MSLLGHIQNGVVVFDAPVPLPDGTAVHVHPIETSGASLTTSRNKSLLDRLGDVVGKVDHLPPDASLNVDRYLYGRDKK